MKMLAEYLEKAITFERMAAEEKDAKLKAALEKQAAACRKLAAEKRSTSSGRNLRHNQSEPHCRARGQVCGLGRSAQHPAL